MVIRKNIGNKVLLTLVGITAVVFYDTTIPLINGIIQLKINILGFFLEPLLQWAFNISLREAQILSAWIYLLIVSFIFWYLFRKFYKVLIATFYSARRFWLVLNRWQKIGLFFLFMVLFVSTVKVVFLFI